MGLKKGARRRSWKCFRFSNFAALILPAFATVALVELSLSNYLPHHRTPTTKYAAFSRLGDWSVLPNIASRHIEAFKKLPKFRTNEENSSSAMALNDRSPKADVKRTPYSRMLDNEDPQMAKLLELESEEMQAQHGLYPLCPLHSVVQSAATTDRKRNGGRGGGKDAHLNGSGQFPESSPGVNVFYPTTIPSLTFVRDRYVRMYNHWRLAVSQIRAQLALASEPPYVKPPRGLDPSSPPIGQPDFVHLIAMAADAAGVSLEAPADVEDGAGKKTGGEGGGGAWNSSLWANQKAPMRGFCSFARTILDPQGQVLSPSRVPRLLLFDGSLVYLKLSGARGPQGDIMQWADLLIALHLIGYGPGVHFPLTYKPCPQIQDYDLVFSDYTAMLNSMCSFRHTFLHGAPFALRCKLRLLDLFGTQEPFNSGFRSPYGNLGLPSLRQVLTLQPDYAPENTFLGTVSAMPGVAARFQEPSSSTCTPLPHHPAPGSSRQVSTSGQDSCRHPKPPLVRTWKALVWGKGALYFQNDEQVGAAYTVEKYLLRVANHVPLEATAALKDRGKIPDFVNITGRVPTPAEFGQQLSKYALVVGLGTPLMAAGLLDVVASPGVPLLLPRFHPPWTRVNNKAMELKPTNEGLSSQHPFLEHALGPPFVYAVDAADLKAVDLALAAIREDYETLNSMSVGDRQREYARRQHLVRKALQPYYSAESFIHRVRNIVNRHEECFGCPRKELDRNATEVDEFEVEKYRKRKQGRTNGHPGRTPGIKKG